MSDLICGVCHEGYKWTDRVFATTVCGHVFHDVCLFRWLGEIITCPQCGMVCDRPQIYRLQLNFKETQVAQQAKPKQPEGERLRWHCMLETFANGEGLPEYAIKSGTDADGNWAYAYVARVNLSGDLLPAMFVPKKGGAYTTRNGQEYFVRYHVEVLDDEDCAWVKSSGGKVPKNAVETGKTQSGETLYTGRTQYKGITLPGKVHRHHQVMYMPYKGHEVSVDKYEVLVWDPDKATERISQTYVF